MEPALERHDAIVRQAIESHGGYVFKTVGDAFCAAFASAGDAVGAAGAAQRRLHGRAVAGRDAAPGPHGAAHRRVRASGTATTSARPSTAPPGSRPPPRRPGRAVPHDRRRSSATPCPTGGPWSTSAPTGSRTSDGRSRSAQLVVPGLPDEFPPLRSLDNPALANNLPAQSASFVGPHPRRSPEVRDLVTANRLVTLAGAGGSGKTRLALQAAAELLDGSGDGVWLVELAPGAATPTRSRAPSARRSGSPPAGAVRPRHAARRPRAPGRPHRPRQLRAPDRRLRRGWPTPILRRCPTVHLLATSREPLGDRRRGHLPGAVAVASRGADDVDAGDSDAVALFVSRVADQGVDAPAGRRDGAARSRRSAGGSTACRWPSSWPRPGCRSMSLADVHDRLDQRFRLLTGGSRSALPASRRCGRPSTGPTRCSTDVEQTVLRRLSWFADGFDLAAAERRLRVRRHRLLRRRRPARVARGQEPRGERGRSLPAARDHPAVQRGAPRRRGRGRGRAPSPRRTAPTTSPWPRRPPPTAGTRTSSSGSPG